MQYANPILYISSMMMLGIALYMWGRHHQRRHPRDKAVLVGSAVAGIMLAALALYHGFAEQHHQSARLMARILEDQSEAFDLTAGYVANHFPGSDILVLVEPSRSSDSTYVATLKSIFEQHLAASSHIAFEEISLTEAVEDDMGAGEFSQHELNGIIDRLIATTQAEVIVDMTLLGTTCHLDHTGFALLPADRRPKLVIGSQAMPEDVIDNIRAGWVSAACVRTFKPEDPAGSLPGEMDCQDEVLMLDAANLEAFLAERGHLLAF